MKPNIATDRNQSSRLLSAGVKPGTADMQCHYEDILCVGYLYLEQPYSKDIYPAWSFSSLISLLPKEMGIAIGAYPGSDKYLCFSLIDPDVEPIVADTAIEATVQMIEFLTANNYPLNQTEV